MNTSIDHAIARMRRLASMDGLADALERAATDDVIPNAQQYPPERPHQKYIRTFMLRDSWSRTTPQRQGQGWRIVVYNPTDYAPDVVGNQQGLYFVNRWRTIRQIRNEVMPMVYARVAAAVRRVARGR